MFRLWIVSLQPSESTLNFDVTEYATVCTESDNSLAPFCTTLTVCFTEYNYTTWTRFFIKYEHNVMQNVKAIIFF